MCVPECRTALSKDCPAVRTVNSAARWSPCSGISYGQDVLRLFLQGVSRSGRRSGLSPGYRWYPDGALGGVGNNGYSWSSSVSGTNGMNLDFNATWLNPSNANNRAHGFQVRCLQHLPHPVFT